MQLQNVIAVVQFTDLAKTIPLSNPLQVNLTLTQVPLIPETKNEEQTSQQVQQSRCYEGLNWRGICNNPLLSSYISQPCDVLVTPDGNALTSEGKVQLEAILCPRGPSILSTLEMFYGTISDNLKNELGAACGW
jgi:hypothetical protein